MKEQEHLISQEMASKLIEEALEGMKNAYTPYSHFTVGAALLTKDNKIFRGCNIENAAFGPSNCAERTAVFKAVSEGDREFVAIGIVGGKDGSVTEMCPPCGVCRQVLREFADPKNFTVVLGSSPQDYKIYRLEELLPLSFGPDYL